MFEDLLAIFVNFVKIGQAWSSYTDKASLLLCVCCVLFRPVRKLVACGFSKSIWSNYPFQTLTIWSQSNSRGVIKSFSLTGGVNKHNTWIITYHKFNMSEEQQPCPTDKSPSTDGEIDKISPSRTGPRFILPKGVALKFHLCFCKVWKLSIIIT